MCEYVGSRRIEVSIVKIDIKVVMVVIWLLNKIFERF